MVSATGTTVAFAVTDRPAGTPSTSCRPAAISCVPISPDLPLRGARFVEIRASAETVRLIQLRREGDAPVGTTGVPTASIMTAGAVGCPVRRRSDHPSRTPGRDPSTRRARLAAASSQAQRAEGRTFRVRSSRDAAPDEAAPVEAVASFFTGFPFSGELNLLTTACSTAPPSCSRAIARRAAWRIWRSARLRGSATGRPRGAHPGRRRPRGSSPASYIARGTPSTHAFDLGMSYGSQQYRGGNPACFALAAEGDRHVGALHGFDHWTVARRVQALVRSAAVLLRLPRSDGLLSPRVAFSVMPVERTRVRAVVSQRLLAPGAEEFLPPPSAGRCGSRRSGRSLPSSATAEFLVERVRPRRGRCRARDGRQPTSSACAASISPWMTSS